MPPLSKEFLLSRGSCCGNGCYNCPYIPRATRSSTKIDPKIIEELNSEDIVRDQRRGSRSSKQIEPDN